MSNFIGNDNHVGNDNYIDNALVIRKESIKANIVWTCRDGRKVRIIDMDDQHLCNTINYLRRNYNTIRINMLIRMDHYLEDAPPGAFDACDQEYNELVEETDITRILEYCVPEFRSLMTEFNNRGLDKEFIHDQ